MIVVATHAHISIYLDFEKDIYVLLKVISACGLD